MHASEKLMRLVVKAHMDKNLKMEGDYHGQSWTMWFLHKEGVLTVGYSLLVICGLWRNSTFPQHCVQTEPQQWRGNCTGSCL
jgi:hypothetical protein